MPVDQALLNAPLWHSLIHAEEWCNAMHSTANFASLQDEILEQRSSWSLALTATVLGRLNGSHTDAVHRTLALPSAQFNCLLQLSDLLDSWSSQWQGIGLKPSRQNSLFATYKRFLQSVKPKSNKWLRGDIWAGEVVQKQNVKADLQAWMNCEEMVDLTLTSTYTVVRL